MDLIGGGNRYLVRSTLIQFYMESIENYKDYYLEMAGEGDVLPVEFSVKELLDYNFGHNFGLYDWSDDEKINLIDAMISDLNDYKKALAMRTDNTTKR